ncbi:HEAT repeat domain-containing protein [Pseudoclavibacter helvolus]|uniref:HEAT repeat domain-containing protein n=1 Tax=Pseudoclavibacter helvolus TaxID=255205 RepID=UPI003C70F724
MAETSASNPAPVPVELPLEQRLAAAVERYGQSEFVRRVLHLIKGYDEGDDLLLFVGGDHAQGILDGAPVLYWPELWGTRALLYVWDVSAAPAVIGTLGNPAWRVREMGARVVAAREIPAVAELAGLLGDSVARVRSAAARALGAVGALEDVDRLRPLLKDPEIDVRRSAQQSIDALRARFPRG